MSPSEIWPGPLHPGRDWCSVKDQFCFLGMLLIFPSPSEHGLCLLLQPSRCLCSSPPVEIWGTRHTFSRSVLFRGWHMATWGSNLVCVSSTVACELTMVCMVFIFKGLLTTNQNTHKINRRICGRDQMWLVKLKIFTVWPLIEKVAAPWPCQHNSFAVQAGTCLLSVSGPQRKATGGSTWNSLSSFIRQIGSSSVRKGLCLP